MSACQLLVSENCRLPAIPETVEWGNILVGTVFPCLACKVTSLIMGWLILPVVTSAWLLFHQIRPKSLRHPCRGLLHRIPCARWAYRAVPRPSSGREGCRSLVGSPQAPAPGTRSCIAGRGCERPEGCPFPDAGPVLVQVGNAGIFPPAGNDPEVPWPRVISQGFQYESATGQSWRLY